MSNQSYQRTYLADYQAPVFLVEHLELEFELDPKATVVTAQMRMLRNPDCPDTNAPLELDGKDHQLLSIALDGQLLVSSGYSIENGLLRIPEVPDSFVLNIKTQLAPEQNHSGLGMLVCGGVIATQCEAQGFRRLTWFPDRPDVLATYTVRLTADQGRYPVLLSNGNPVDRGVLPDGRHWITWNDPAPKPSYIFAVVAGQLDCLPDHFVTKSGRRIELGIYSSAELIEKCDFAMGALKRSMRWEEDVYDLECDVDVYNVVALDDWAGAMENKGLNIYDAASIVAGPMVTGDNDYMVIERIIGHEYFHNWSGNRITCRDWFQLSMKEGLTRFRDQEFARDMSAPDIKRIEFVMRLRRDQFAEDQGPNAHCVQPDSYLQIQNFYTPTVYDKGAELVRMIHTLLGKEGYFSGIALFVERHDGEAVTINEFLQAMEDASGRDLEQFRRWYHQAGTPRVELSTDFDPSKEIFSVHASQAWAGSSGKAMKEPLHIPLSVGLIASKGEEIASKVLELTQEKQTFLFSGVKKKPVLSALRGFSAPVELHIDRSDSELAFLMRVDQDAFARWEASQQLLLRALHRLLSGSEDDLSDYDLPAIVAALLDDEKTDPGLIAQLISLPDEPAVAAGLIDIDMSAIDSARRHLKKQLGLALQGPFQLRYHALARTGEYRPEAGQIAARTLRHVCLDYLVGTGQVEWLDQCEAHIRSADNLTDALGGLTIISRIDCAQRTRAIDDFFQRWCSNPLVYLKWLFLVGSSPVPGVIDSVQSVMKQAGFELMNPAHGMNLLGGFFRRNYVEFHNPNGSGYRFLADILLQMDQFRPDAGAWLMPQMMQWRRHEPARCALMRGQLQRIFETEGISPGLYELVSNALAEE